VLSVADHLTIFLSAEILLALWRATLLEKGGGFDGWDYFLKNAFFWAQKAAI